MAEEKKEEAPAAEATEAAPKKSKKKLFMIVGGVVLLLVAAGVPLLLMSKKTEEKPIGELDHSVATQEEEEDHAKLLGSEDENELVEGEEPLGAIYPLETFVVNIEGGKFIRIQVQLEFADRAISSRFYARIIPIRDQMISLFSSKTQADLESAKSKENLKAELKDLVNDVLKKEEVKRIYFSQFIIQ